MAQFFSAYLNPYVWSQRLQRIVLAILICAALNFAACLDQIAEASAQKTAESAVRITVKRLS